MGRLLARKLRRDMRGRAGQFLAVVIVVFLGVTLFGLSYDAYRNLIASYDRVFVLTNFADHTIAGGDTDAILAAGRRVPGVAEAAERRVADAPVKVGDTTLLGRLVGLPADGQPPINGVMILNGEYLTPGSPTDVLVEKHMVEHFGLTPGSRLSLQTADGWETLVMRGEAASAEYIWPAPSRQQVLASQDEFGVLFVSEDLMDRLTPGAAVRQAVFTYEDGADRASVDAALSAVALANGAVDSFTQAEQPSNAALHEDINGFGEMSVMFPVLFLGAAALATYILLTRLVFSQRSQIGLMLANGFRRRTVFLHYLSFGLVVGIVGAIPGIVAGMLLARLATSLYTSAISVPVNVIQFHWVTLIVGIAFGIVAGVLATLPPAMRAARFTPAEAMSGAAGAPRAGRSLLERIVPALRRLPTHWKMVLRGIGRSRRRSLLTVLGVVLAAVLVLASWGMIDTTIVLLDRQFNEIQSQDAEAYLAPGDVDKGLAAVAAVSGVERAEPVADLPASVRSSTALYSTGLQAFESGTTMHRFLLAGGGETDLPAQGILLGSALRDILAVSEGDSVEVTLPGLDSSFKAEVAGFVDEPLGTFVYMSLPALRTALGGSVEPVNAAMVTFAAGADPAAVRADLSSLPEVTVVVDSRALYAMAQSFMGLFYAFVGLMVALGGIMALALIYTTMSSNISERLTELASLRAAGMSRRRLALLLTSENMLLTVLGIVPGLIAGYYAARLFMASFSSDLFTFNLALRPWTPVAVAAALLIAALLSQWPVLRAVERIDIAKTVRERSI
ncbi:MAG: FtsX-like permease family protein [Thermoleophilia bacterium]